MTVYDTLELVTVTIRTTLRTRRITSTSTISSTQLPRKGCSITKTASSTTRTTTASCSAESDAAPTTTVTIPMVADSVMPTPWPEPIPQRATDGGIVNATRPLAEQRSLPHQKRVPLCDIIFKYYLLIPQSPFDTKELNRLVENYWYRHGDVGLPIRLPFTKIWAPSHGGFTGGWFFEFVTRDFVAQLKKDVYKTEVRVYPRAPYGLGRLTWYRYKLRVLMGLDHGDRDPKADRNADSSSDSSSGSDSGSGSDDGSSSGSDDGSDAGSDESAQPPLRRVPDQSLTWDLSAVSVPPGELWEGNEAWHEAGTGKYSAIYHANAGHKQQVYMYDRGVPWVAHSEFALNRPEVMPMGRYGGRGRAETQENDHASQIAARVVGRELGVAKRAKLWAIGNVDTGAGLKGDTVLATFRVMEAYVRILEHVASNGWGTRSVFTTSTGIGDVQSIHPVWEAMRNIMGTFPSSFSTGAPEDTLDSLAAANVYAELASLGVVLTSSAGNLGNDISPSHKFPHWMADPKIIKAAAALADKQEWSNPSTDDRGLRFVRHMDKLKRVPHCMMLVGAVNRAMELSTFSQMADHVVVYAPGEDSWALTPPRAFQNADTIKPYTVDFFGNVMHEKGKTEPLMLRGTSIGSLPTPSLLLLTSRVHWILMPN